ncbi:MAG TPA: formate dehydrogenase accessory sulfurtransferase FdhD [Spirochaetota bacterium]|nr:formate dehydrogenase accessory sulfurtransferase FdhD [Spirochaetota bacterium]
MALPQYVTVGAYRCTGSAIAPIDIPVSAEYAFTLSVNGNPFVSIVCSGSDLDKLALGHLAAEGVIRSADEVHSVEIDEQAFTINIDTAENDDLLERLFRIRSIASGCGQSGSQPADAIPRTRGEVPRVRASVVTAGMREFLHASEIHKLTHGVHSAALYSVEGRRQCFFDEIGRHNAIDKILGYALKSGLSLERSMILSTGRLASEIVMKAIAVSAPVLVSRAAPTARSIELARQAGMLMIGGVRPSGFYIFSGEGFVEC